jgi:hypothetical protein
MVLTLALLALVPQEPTPEQRAHAKLAKAYNHPEQVEEAAEAAGLASPRFETRYAALLVRIHRTLAAGRGFEALHQTILGTAGDGAASAAHLKALAESLRKAIACSACEAKGKVSCAPCKGSGRRDVACKDCKGEGRVKPPGVGAKSDATVKCRNCDGLKTFKNARCPDCSADGVNACASCKGQPWPEGRCLTKECAYGRVPCGACKGKGKLKLDCPKCEGGRIRPTGAVGGTDLAVKCRDCEKPDGTHGDGFIEADCKACEKTGRVTCKACGGTFGRGPGAVPTVQPASVFGTEPCRECGGAGRPKTGSPAACGACLGLGVRILPKADPARALR